MPDFNLKFRYDPKEYEEAMRLHFSSVIKLKRDIIIGFMLLIFGLICLYYFEYSFIWILDIALSIVLLLISFSAYYIIPKLAFNRDPKLKDDYNLIFNNDEIIFNTEKLNSTLEWKIYDKVLENTKFFLIYWGKYTFTVIPKRAFKDEMEINNFRNLLKEKISSYSSQA